MSITTLTNIYLIDIGNLLYKVLLYNTINNTHLDEYIIFELVLSFIRYNPTEILNTNYWYRLNRTDELDEFIVELADDLMIDILDKHDIDIRYSDKKLFSYRFLTATIVEISIKNILGVTHEDIDDLLKDME